MKSINDLNVFLVDDDDFCRTLYKQHLNNLGCVNVTEFCNGFDCLSEMDKLPDVIFLDHALGNVTGLEVLKKIKQINPEAFVVYLSGNANVMTAVKALKKGASDYIVKGIFELENMTKIIKQAAARGKVSPVSV